MTDLDIEAARLARLPDTLTWRPSGNRHIYDSDDGRQLSIDPAHDGDDIRGWVEAREHAGSPVPDVYGSWNLMGARTVSGLVGLLGDSWATIIRHAVYDVIARVGEGDPATRLADQTDDTTDPWLIPRLIGTSGATMLIAPGSTGKSLLSVAICAAVATGHPAWLGMQPTAAVPVLYLDWEDTAAVHAERLHALARAVDQRAPSDVWYRPMRVPLARAGESVRRQVDDLGVGLVAIDSVMLARGGDAMGPTDTIAMFSAMRELGVPIILTDHKSKSDQREGRRGAFGSIVGHNSVRRAWEVTAKSDLASGGFILRLEDIKSNHTAKMQPLGLRFDIVAKGDGRMDTARIRPTERLPAPAASAADSLADRIRAELSGRPAAISVTELAEALDVEPGTVRKTLSRYPDRFENVGTSNTGAWRVKGGGRDNGRQDDLPTPY